MSILIYFIGVLSFEIIMISMNINILRKWVIGVMRKWGGGDLGKRGNAIMVLRKWVIGKLD